jgi:hypothetical protein
MLGYRWMRALRMGMCASTGGQAQRRNRTANGKKTMSLAKKPGVNCVDAFDQIFNNAYAALNGASKKTEPHFVRRLISQATVQQLNIEAANLYDETINVVKFRAAFLHGAPYAKFSAGALTPRCELADGMLVVHVTEPGGGGLHVVTRRAACLLMVKRSDDAVPKAFAYDPVVGPDPVGTDESQFYLFNRWPAFDLETGSINAPKNHGKYNLALPTGQVKHVAHDIGKFGVLWGDDSQPTAWTSSPGNNVNWLAGEPTPSFALNPSQCSLGKLLENFVDGQPNSGRVFDPAISNSNGWDALMSRLLGYAVAGPAAPGSSPLGVDSILAKWKWGGQARNVNPQGLGFLTTSGNHLGMEVFEAADMLRSTVAQHARDLVLADYWDYPFHYPFYGSFRSLERALLPPVPAQFQLDGDEPRGLPVLIATVTRFKPLDDRTSDDPLTLRQKVAATEFALERVHELNSLLR